MGTVDEPQLIQAALTHHGKALPLLLTGSPLSRSAPHSPETPTISGLVSAPLVFPFFLSGSRLISYKRYPMPCGGGEGRMAECIMVRPRRGLLRGHFKE